MGNAAGLSLKSPRFLSNRWGPPQILISLEFGESEPAPYLTVYLSCTARVMPPKVPTKTTPTGIIWIFIASPIYWLVIIYSASAMQKYSEAPSLDERIGLSLNEGFSSPLEHR